MSKNKYELINFKNFKDVSDLRIPFDILVLDILTGGGVPLYKYTILCGKESSGKTSLALRLANNFIETYKGNVLYLDVEKTFDKNWASNFIKNTDNIYIAQPDYGEEAVDIAVENFKTDKFGLLIVDSLAELIPIADADKSAMEDSFASIPKLANKLLRKLLPLLGIKQKAEIPSAIIILNQLTSNMNVHGFQSPYKKPAGMLQNFIATLDIQCYTKGFKESKGIPVIVTHQFTIRKAKISGAMINRSGEYKMALVDIDNYKVGDIIEEDIILNLSKKLGIAKQVSKGWDVLGLNFNKLDEIIETLRNNKEFRDNVKKEILKECKKNIWATSDTKE
jgi:recombination protein RecA